ncbi:hypothetical protein ACFL54_08240 [Planctomycetota bacterium]
MILLVMASGSFGLAADGNAGEPPAKVMRSKPLFEVKLQDPSPICDYWMSIVLSGQTGCFGWIHIEIIKGTFDGKSVFWLSHETTIVDPESNDTDKWLKATQQGICNKEGRMIKEVHMEKSAAEQKYYQAEWQDGHVIIKNLAVPDEKEQRIESTEPPFMAEDMLFLLKRTKKGEEIKWPTFDMQEVKISMNTVKDLGEYTIQYGDQNKIPVIKYTSTSDDGETMTFFVTGDRQIQEINAESQGINFVKVDKGLNDLVWQAWGNPLLSGIFAQTGRQAWTKSGQEYKNSKLGFNIKMPKEEWVRDAREEGVEVISIKHTSGEALCIIRVERVLDGFTKQKYATKEIMNGLRIADVGEETLDSYALNVKKSIEGYTDLKGKVRKSKTTLGKKKAVRLKYIRINDNFELKCTDYVVFHKGGGYHIETVFLKNKAKIYQRQIDAIKKSIRFLD